MVGEKSQVVLQIVGNGIVRRAHPVLPQIESMVHAFPEHGEHVVRPWAAEGY